MRRAFHLHTSTSLTSSSILSLDFNDLTFFFITTQVVSLSSSASYDPVFFRSCCYRLHLCFCSHVCASLLPPSSTFPFLCSFCTSLLLPVTFLYARVCADVKVSLSSSCLLRCGSCFCFKFFFLLCCLHSGTSPSMKLSDRLPPPCPLRRSPSHSVLSTA